MKICSKCKQEKELDNFSNKGESNWCKTCVREASRESYLRNKDKILNKSKIKDKENTDRFNEFKSTLFCNKCKENRWYILDFHHIDPKEKEFNICNIKRTKNIDKLKKELEKCVVLCSNCHREFHYLEREGITIEKYLAL
jgi:hypothetical protein